MKKLEFNAQSGKSLVEMLIVLAVGAILVSMAVVRMTSARTNMDRQNVAREFKVNLERARYDAVKRRASVATNMTRITITGTNAYKVWVDSDQDGTLEASEERTVSFAGRNNVKILGTDLVYPVTIRFDRFGNTTTTNASGAQISPVFTFCEGDCTLATATVANSNIIALSQTGTVSMLNGGEALPTFNNPSVSTVGMTDNVNDWLVVREDGVITLPTPTASPTGSATPTPSVVYCSSGQRPSQTSCTCKLPMTVRSSGKCQ